jgi:organic hydroperoxide reductase OsmC/OhrA
MKIEKVLYTAHAKATGGRDGRAVSSDGLLDVKLAVPKEMGARAAVRIRSNYLPRATQPASSAQ